MPITLPTPATAWNILACQRVTYTSVVQVMREVIYKVATELIARGWTVKGSSDGVAGGMDGVNRWTDATKAGVRNNGAAGPQSWIVLTDADGANIMFSYNSAADDIYNYQVSSGGLAVVAATATHEPTATDAQVLNKFYTTTPGTIVNSATSLDRIVSVWTSPDSKSFRVAIARNGAWTALFGKERFTPATYAAGILVHPAIAFYINGAFTAGTGNITNSNTVVSTTAANQFIARGKRTDGAGTVLTCARYLKIIGQNAVAVGPSESSFASTQAELQGAASYALRRLGLYSITTSHQGDVGLFIDWFLGRITGAGDGDTYGALNWVVVNASSGLIWPWNQTTVVAMS